jgi:hypothetical protein
MPARGWVPRKSGAQEFGIAASIPLIRTASLETAVSRPADSKARTSQTCNQLDGVRTARKFLSGHHQNRIRWDAERSGIAKIESNHWHVGEPPYCDGARGCGRWLALPADHTALVVEKRFWKSPCDGLAKPFQLSFDICLRMFVRISRAIGDQ